MYSSTQAVHKQYDALREQRMSKEKSARIANTNLLIYALFNVKKVTLELGKKFCI